MGEWICISWNVRGESGSSQGQLILRGQSWATRGIAWGVGPVTSTVRKTWRQRPGSTKSPDHGASSQRPCRSNTTPRPGQDSAYGSVPDRWSPWWGRAVAMMESLGMGSWAHGQVENGGGQGRCMDFHFCCISKHFITLSQPVSMDTPRELREHQPLLWVLDGTAEDVSPLSCRQVASVITLQNRELSKCRTGNLGKALFLKVTSDLRDVF